jgi:predicted transcriptional regulator
MSDSPTIKIGNKTHYKIDTAIMIMSKKAISTTEAAELLGVSTRRVRCYIEEGIKTPTGKVKLRATLITNRMYVIERKDLDKFKKMYDSLKS